MVLAGLARLTVTPRWTRSKARRCAPSRDCQPIVLPKCANF